MYAEVKAGMGWWSGQQQREGWETGATAKARIRGGIDGSMIGETKEVDEQQYRPRRGSGVDISEDRDGEQRRCGGWGWGDRGGAVKAGIGGQWSSRMGRWEGM